MNEELGNGRNMDHYAEQMDGSLQVKIAEIAPHVAPGIVVDAGFGTGGLLAALRQQYPMSHFVGIEYSREFFLRGLQRFSEQENVQLLRGDVRGLRRLGCQNATTVIFSSVLHEVFSYNGYSEPAVREALENAERTLASGGRIIIRDGIAPERSSVAMWVCPEERERFHRFAREYRNGVGIPFEDAWVADRPVFILDARDAYEFMNKKDYQLHWELEIQEEYGFWRRREWELALQRAGFVLQSLDEILSPWIVEHRFASKIKLFDPVTEAELPFFPTHCLIVAERPAQ